MKLIIETKRIKNLSSSEMNLMNRGRIMNWGKKAIVNWKKEYPLSSEVIFVKESKKTVAFLVLRPIKIKYLGKEYNIFGICSVISFGKGKAYGRVLIAGTINYLRTKDKTGLGFTEATKFFEKAGLNVKKDLVKRFVYINPKTKEKVIDNEGDGIYYEGKDKFVSKVLSTKSIVYIDILHW